MHIYFIVKKIKNYLKQECHGLFQGTSTTMALLCTLTGFCQTGFSDNFVVCVCKIVYGVINRNKFAGLVPVTRTIMDYILIHFTKQLKYVDESPLRRTKYTI